MNGITEIRKNIIQIKDEKFWSYSMIWLLICLITELFIRGRKLNISLVFITQSYFALPKILDWI